MKHRLVFRHRNGHYEAHCSCGGWREYPAPLRLSRVREVFGRLRAEHRTHIRHSEGTPEQLAAIFPDQ